VSKTVTRVVLAVLSSVELAPASALGQPARTQSVTAGNPEHAEHPSKRAGEHGGVNRVSAGATYRRLYDIPVYGLDFGIAIGKWDADGRGRFFAIDGVWARSENGLGVRAVYLGYRADYAFPPFLLGFTAGPGFVLVERFTVSADLLSFGIQAAGHWALGLWRTPRTLLSLEARINTDWLPRVDQTLFWGPSLELALRF